MPELLHLLVYEYVDNMTERRVPHREAHLDLIRRYHEAGRCVIAGAIGDPVHGGLLAFRRIEPWTVVAGA
jgi:uncharacterized protein